MSLFLTGPGITTLPIDMLASMEFVYDPSIAALSALLALMSMAIVMIAEKMLGLSRYVSDRNFLTIENLTLAYGGTVARAGPRPHHRPKASCSCCWGHRLRQDDAMRGIGGRLPAFMGR